jgi:hypothetical protein
MGLKEKILAANDLARESVEVPEWGCTLYLRIMTGTERDALESESMASRGGDSAANMRNFRARLIARVACDEAGVRIFSDSEIEALGAKSGLVLDRLYAIASRINGYTKKDVEDIAKN